MRELTRSNDPVLLSYLTSELRAEGIEATVLDAFAASVLAPMNATAMQRVMVGPDDFAAATAVLAEAEGRVSEDALLDGRVTILQPVDGFRSAIDPLILAATVPAGNGDRVLDVGTGTGAAALALMVRAPWAWAHGIDIQADLIALARLSAARNDMASRLAFDVADVADAAVPARLFDHVMSNPPFLPAGGGQRPENAARAKATVESTADLGAWLGFMAACLADGGTFSVVHRRDRLDEIVGHLETLGIGALRALELVAVDDGRPVKRVVVQGAKGAGVRPLEISRVVVHTEDGTYTPDAEAILRDARALPISG